MVKPWELWFSALLKSWRDVLMPLLLSIFYHLKMQQEGTILVSDSSPHETQGLKLQFGTSEPPEW